MPIRYGNEYGPSQEDVNFTAPKEIKIPEVEMPETSVENREKRLHDAEMVFKGTHEEITEAIIQMQKDSESNVNSILQTREKEVIAFFSRKNNFEYN